jgi:SAM-dependent methyltransferase
MESKKEFSLIIHPDSEYYGVFKSAVPEGYQRSPTIQYIVDQNFIELTNMTESGYLFTGSEDYSFNFFTKVLIKASAIIEQMIAAPHDGPVHVLDIGAGDFQFVDSTQKKHWDAVKVYGIGASDLFRTAKNIDEYHVINNAENLSRVFAQQFFDIIVSRATFMHFIDPVDSLCQAYEKLAPGGTLLIDILPIPGCEAHLKDIVDYIRKKGYLILAKVGPQQIEPLIIQKPKDGTLNQLIIPVLLASYSKLNGLRYKPHPIIMKKLTKTDQNKFYPEDIEHIFQAARTFSPELYNHHTDLPHLFADSEYQKLKPSQQLIFILAIHAKSMNKENYDSILSKLNQLAEDSHPFKVIILDLIQLIGGSALYHLESQFSSTNWKISFSSECQLNCIHFAAETEIRCKILMKELLEYIIRMDIPFELSQNKHIGEQGCLDFPSLGFHASPAYDI